MNKLKLFTIAAFTLLLSSCACYVDYGLPYVDRCGIRHQKMY